MKVLTVKQPWADLIVSGVKDIENRTWRTNYRGRILIHSAQSVTPREELRAYPLPALRRAVGQSCESGDEYLTSSIIGSVEITDCVMNHPSEWAEQGVWNWVLSNPQKYDVPIKNVRGKLSIWDYPLPTAKGYPYGVLEYLLWGRSKNQCTDRYEEVMRGINRMNKSEYLERIVELLDGSANVSIEISNSIQFFRSGDGESLATIRATPDKTFRYEANELGVLVSKLNEMNN